jgi:hypothetical protein
VELEPERRGSLAYRDTLTVPLSFALPLLDEAPPAAAWVTRPDPDELATYRLPSPNLVTTVGFLERYCWGPATDAGAGTQGLAFRPRQITAGQPDLWGILWFPSDGTGEWALEARYTDFLPTDVVEIDHGVEWHPNLSRPAIPLRNDRRFINRVEWTVDRGAVRHPEWVRLHYPTPRNVLYQFYAPEYVRKAGLHGPPPPLQRGDMWQEPIWAGTVVRRTEYRVLESVR